MADPDLPAVPETFRPWGWPVSIAAFLSAMTAALAFVTLRDGDGWFLLVAAPLLVFVVTTMVLQMAIRIQLDGDRITWMTPVRRRESRLGLLSSVRPGPGNGRDVLRLIEFADGQTLRVTEGAEFDRFMRALEARRVDFRSEL